MKLKFGAMAGMVLALLGVEKFAKDEKNNIVLSAEEQDKVKKAYGEKFLSKLMEVESTGEQASDEDTQALIDAMKQHFNADLNRQLEDEKRKALDAEKKLKAEKDELASQLASKEHALRILSGQPEQAPAPVNNNGFFGTKKKYQKGDSIMHVNMEASHYDAIREAGERGFPVLAAGTGIDVSDVRAEFGKYLGQNGQQIRIDIYNAILNGFTSAPEMTPELAENEYRATQALITSVMQQFKPKWTPLGGFKFTPITIKNRRHKINVAIVPADVLDSYVAYLYEQGLAPDQMPIVKYLIDEMILPALLDDLEMRAAFKGKFVEVTYDGTGAVVAGGTPETSMDGVETILVDNRTNADSGINYYPGAKTIAELQAMTPENIVKYFTGFAQWISNAYKVEKIYCSHDMYVLYKNAYKAYWAGSSGVENPYFGQDLIDFTNKVLKPLDGMFGSPILFATVARNWKKLKWKKELPFVINDIQKHDYEVRIFGEFSFATGFAIGDFVFAAVPASYNPQTQLTAAYGNSTDYKAPVKVKQAAAITLLSNTSSEAQTVEENDAIETIIYAIKSSAASIAWTGTASAATAPAGITALLTDENAVISGTPTTAGTYGYTITATGIAGGANATDTGTITVTTGA